MLDIISPPLFNAQLSRSMGVATYQGAEIGECLAIADNIKPGDKESWYNSWYEFAVKNFQMATSFQKNGMKLDARMAYLRACTYYRTAFFFLEDHPEDTRIDEAMKMSIVSFHHAIELFDTPVEKISIPFRNLMLPGYLYLNQSDPAIRKPIIIDTGGGDGTKEESYFNVAAEAIQRGFHCLTFEGPGQGSLLRLDKIPFIPDWESVMEKVVDYVLQLPQVDPARIILIGRSFGGYLATRAVTKEHRIAACIVDPGMVESMGGMEEKFANIAKTKLPELANLPTHELILEIMKHDEQTRFMMESRMWRFGAKTIEELLIAARQYSVSGMTGMIRCPMLVCDNTLEYITKGQAKKLYDELTCKKNYILFNEKDGTGGHCEPLTPRLFSAKIYEWLKEMELFQ